MNRLKNSLKNRLSTEWFETLEKLDIFLDDKWFEDIDSIELLWKWQNNQEAFQKFFDNFWNKITWLEDLLEELTENEINLSNFVLDTSIETKNKAQKLLAINSEPELPDNYNR